MRPFVPCDGDPRPARPRSRNGGSRRGRYAAGTGALRALSALAGERTVAFDEKRDLVFHRRKALDLHVNGMQFTAFDSQGRLIESREYFSVGGGFVVTREPGEDGFRQLRVQANQPPVPYDFTPARISWPSREALAAA